MSLPTATERPSLRLAILNRHFWPISNSAEMEVAWLATAIADAGVDVDVLTVRWQKFWPERLVYRGANVLRLPKPLSGPFGKYRFNKALIAHLVNENYDGLIAFGLDEDACTAAVGFGKQMPVDLRVTLGHLDTMGSLNGGKSFGRRTVAACQAATRILVDCEETGIAITRQFADPKPIEQKIVVVPSCVEIDADFVADLADGKTVSPFRTPARQFSSRAALSDAHPILQIDPYQALVVTCTSMANDLGICDLVKAWKEVQSVDPLSRLWIIGEDKVSNKVWNTILENDLVYTAIMPGFFDHLSEIFQAADVYVHPTRSGLSCCLLDAAAAHGVCTIATETETGLQEIAAQFAQISQMPSDLADQAFVQRPAGGLLVGRQSPSSLANAITYALQHPDFRARVGSQSRRSFASEIAQQPRVNRWLDAFTAPSDAATEKALENEVTPAAPLKLTTTENLL